MARIEKKLISSSVKHSYELGYTRTITENLYEFYIFEQETKSLLLVKIDEAIDEDFIYNENYPHGASRVRVDNYFGVINDKGQWIIEPKYEFLGEYTFGCFIVGMREYFSAKCYTYIYGIIDFNDNLLVDIKYSNIKCIGNDYDNVYFIADDLSRTTIYDTKGKELPTSKDNIMYTYKNCKPFRKNNKWGICDDRNNILVSAQYEKITTTGSPHIIVKEGGKYGLHDMFGKDIVPILFDMIDMISGNYILTLGDNKYKIHCHKNDNEILWDSTNKCERYIITERSNQYKLGVFDILTQKIIIPQVYDKITKEGSFFIACLNKTLSVYNSRFEFIFTIECNSLRILQNQYFIYTKENNDATSYSGIIDLYGNIICKAAKYTDIVRAVGRYFIVTKDNLYGLITKEGKEIIKPQEETIHVIGNRFLLSKRTLLDEDLTLMTVFPKAIQNTINPYGNIYNCKNNIYYKSEYPFDGAKVACKTYHYGDCRIGNRFGFLDENDNELIPFTYDEVKDFKNGFAKVRKGSFWGIINKKGEFTIENITFPKTYIWAWKIDENFYVVQTSENRYGVIDCNMNIIVPCTQTARYIIAKSISHIKEQNKYSPLKIIKGNNNFYGLNMNDKIIYPPIFISCDKTIWGTYIVNFFGKFGLIGLDGEYIITPQYKELNQYREGFASFIKHDGRHGFINPYGEEIRCFEKGVKIDGYFKDGIVGVKVYGGRFDYYGTMDKSFHIDYCYDI